MENIKPINPFITLGKYQLGEKLIESSIARNDVIRIECQGFAEGKGEKCELTGAGWLELWQGLISRGWKQISVIENAAKLNIEYLKWRKQNRKACAKA